MSSSSASSSSSSSATASGRDTVKPSKSNQTIGLAVGLGVGIPILLTILILIWVTIRHRKKLREEDEIDKDIDFNGDVSFWSPTQPDTAKFGAYNTGLGGGNKRRDTLTTNHTTNIDGESTVNLSEIDAMSNSDHANPSLSQMYTPELGFTQGSQENFSRAIHNVYGPSPAYPSSEKLRAPSVAGSMRSGWMGHQRSGSFSSSTVGGGPFATPPRSGGTPIHMNSSQFPQSASFTQSSHPYVNHYRRESIGSVPPERTHSYQGFSESEVNDGPAGPGSVGGPLFSHNSSNDEHPLPPINPPQLNGLRESPHPYSNLAGTQSAQSIQSAAASADFVDARDIDLGGADDSETSDPPSDPTSPLRGSQDRLPGRHIYHQQAKDRNSTYAFNS